jgi:hypothetical protein
MGWDGWKFPEGPPKNFDPENKYADPVALLEEREYITRQKMIKVEKAKVQPA